MIHKTVSIDELSRATRWRVEIFTDLGNEEEYCAWPKRKIGDIAIESSDAVLPADLPSEQVLYVGLENVESVTGEPIGLKEGPKSAIRSRSKLFREGQLLYGRLRPYLRKAFLARTPFCSGICSTEFIVITPDNTLVLPEVLRTLLVSRAVTEQFSRFQIGAALPRISSKDFFSICVPVPPIAVQHSWLEQVSLLEQNYRQAKSIVGDFPERLDSIVSGLVSGQVST